MKAFYFLLCGTLLLSGCSHSYFIVRHAEKGTSGTNPSDLPLSAEGIARAERIKTLLERKKVEKIYATPTQRAIATAQPLSTALKVKIDTYGPLPDKTFIEHLRTLKKNTLIIGHSNTIDDIANALLKNKRLNDLPDSAYDNLYIIKQKGDKVRLKEKKF